MALTDPKRSCLFFSRSALVAVAAILGSAASPVPDSGNALPTAAVRLYTPTSMDAFDSLGELRLSQKFAAFSLLKGHMDLQFTGTMPDYVDLADNEIQVYRVINAEEFYRMNGSARGDQPLCDRPIRWMGVRKDTLPPPYGTDREVRISFFRFSDYRTFHYTYKDRGDCSTATYELKQ